MSRLEFRGSSDDLIYVSAGDRTEEYHPGYDHDGHGPSAVFAVANLYVFVYYDGIWQFAPRIQREGQELDVDIRVEQAHEYSMKLVLESEDTELSEVPVDMNQVTF